MRLWVGVRMGSGVLGMRGWLRGIGGLGSCMLRCVGRRVVREVA
jgi:hypothetical protein